MTTEAQGKTTEQDASLPPQGARALASRAISYARGLFSRGDRGNGTSPRAASLDYSIPYAGVAVIGREPHEDYTHTESIQNRGLDRVDLPTPLESNEHATVIRNLPTLSEQLMGVEARRSPLQFFDVTVDQTGHTTDPFTSSPSTEGEIIVGLDNFLTQAAADGVEAASSFRENVGIIGRPEREEATRYLAADWLGFLAADEGNKVFVYRPAFANGRRPAKSNEYIASEVEAALHDKVDGNYEAVRGRVLDVTDNLAELAAADPTKTRVAIVDDWAVTAETSVRYAEKLASTLQAAGGGEHVRNIELDLVVARQDQVQRGIQFTNPQGNQQSLPIVAYYRAPAVTGNPGDPSPSGSHSSADKYFQSYLVGFGQQMAQKRGAPVHLPAAAFIAAQYKV